jgi:hypothetical protein
MEACMDDEQAGQVRVCNETEEMEWEWMGECEKIGFDDVKVDVC